MLGLVQPPAITVPLDPGLSDEGLAHFLRDLREVHGRVMSERDPKTGAIRYG